MQGGVCILLHFKERLGLSCGSERQASIWHLQVNRYPAAALVVSNAIMWSYGTSLYGSWKGLWLEDRALGHRAAWHTSILSNLIEVCSSLPSSALQAMLIVYLMTKDLKLKVVLLTPKPIVKGIVIELVEP